MTLLFELLSKGQLPATIWERVHYSAGSTLFEAGSPASKIYYIESGIIRSTLQITLDNQQTISPSFYDIKPGQMLGELSLVDGQPYHIKAVAVEPSDVYEIDNTGLLEFMDNHPEQGYQLIKELNDIIAKRARRCNEKVLSLLTWGLKSYSLDKHL